VVIIPHFHVFFCPFEQLWCKNHPIPFCWLSHTVFQCSSSSSSGHPSVLGPHCCCNSVTSSRSRPEDCCQYVPKGGCNTHRCSFTSCKKMGIADCSRNSKEARGHQLREFFQDFSNMISSELLLSNKTSQSAALRRPFKLRVPSCDNNWLFDGRIFDNCISVF